MRNEKSVQAVSEARFSTRFTRPLYDTYCFSRLPDTIQKLLTGTAHHPLPVDAVGDQWQQYDVVILLLIDGFGWEFFEKLAERYPFLQRFLNAGVATAITAQFPSTTAAHITTINTSLEVGQSGVYEWFYYEPLLDRMITPLLYSYAGDHVANTLTPSGISPEKLYPTQTIYNALQKQGISSYVMQHEGIAHSPYSRVMFQGAHNLPYRYLKDGLARLIEVCARPSAAPTYLYLYFGDIDAMGHRHGLFSPQFSEAADYCFKMFEEELWNKIQQVNKKVACIVTADHGMVPVDPKTTLYLNQVFPDIAHTFVHNAQGNPLVPAGSCRDFFLHVREEHLDTVLQKLRTRFQGVAEVYRTEELIEEGLFGLQKPSQKFLERVGNLVILPYLGESIWWYEKHRFEQHFFAAHGGLTPEEMRSIFLFLTHG